MAGDDDTLTKPRLFRLYLRTSPGPFLRAAAVTVGITVGIAGAIVLVLGFVITGRAPTVEVIIFVLLVLGAAWVVMVPALAWGAAGRLLKLLVGPILPDGPLRTPRLVLRGLRADDEAAAIASLDDEAMAVNGWTAALRDAWEAQLRVPGLAAAAGKVAICDLDDRLLGLAAVTRAEGGDGGVSLGWWLGPTHRGQGYGTEMVRALGGHLLARGWRRVRVGTSVDNAAVQRVMTKVGAHEVERRPHGLPDGSTPDSIWYELRPTAATG